MWNLEKNREKVAMIDENEQLIKYVDIQMFIEKISNVCKQRDVVLCLCRNTIGSIIGYFAFVELQIVPILLDASLEKKLVESVSTSYEPYYIWAPEEMNFEQYWECMNFFGYRLWKKKEETVHIIHPDLAVLLSTSGTTGSSKMVRLSYKNLSENAYSIAEYLEISQSERPITVLPMCYAYGLSIINSHIISGASLLVTTKSVIQKKFWEMVTKYKATSFSGVPYTYQLLERMHFCERDLPYIKTLTQAGGKLPEKLQSLFAEYAAAQDKKFVIMYGQCEATARISYLPCEFAKTKLGSIGKAIPRGKLYIVNEAGKKIEEPGNIGELLYNGPNVMMGYAEDSQDLQLGDIQGDFLLTGDIGYFDEDGFYYIVGRKKRFIKIYGKRISLDEIENYLRDKCGVNCACIEKNEKIVIFLTDIKQKVVVEEELVKVLKIPATVLRFQEMLDIPRNSSGKIQYSKL